MQVLLYEIFGSRLGQLDGRPLTKPLHLRQEEVRVPSGRTRGVSELLSNVFGLGRMATQAVPSHILRSLCMINVESIMLPN